MDNVSLSGVTAGEDRYRSGGHNIDRHHHATMPLDSVQLSKFISYILRHQPDAIGLKLDPQGWIDRQSKAEREQVHEQR